jgi:hypothetical protein
MVRAVVDKSVWRGVKRWINNMHVGWGLAYGYTGGRGGHYDSKRKAQQRE